MSGGKHTPGPWRRSGQNTISGHDCIVAFVGTAEEEVRVFSGERQEADAALIAAAPDLLAACEAAERFMRRLDVDAGDYAAFRSDFDLIVAAIKKARGEP